MITSGGRILPDSAGIWNGVVTIRSSLSGMTELSSAKFEGRSEGTPALPCLQSSLLVIFSLALAEGWPP
ncbi:hypothetical protein B5V46_18930 (plasmid) [Rhodovulum sp. MB263]|nr:hypothetical protein B5V46_18930 [Rhodovulum sp. MB263]